MQKSVGGTLNSYNSTAWVGAGSIIAAPLLAGFILPLSIRLSYLLHADHAYLPSFTSDPRDAALVVTGFATWIAAAIWQFAWAVRLIKHELLESPRRGYALLTIGLFVSALAAIPLSAQWVDYSNSTYASLFWKFLRAWSPSIALAIASIVALVQSRLARLAALYLPFIPLWVVTVHAFATICSLLFVVQLQAPWMMVGIFFATITMAALVIAIWKEQKIQSRAGILAAAFGIPTIILTGYLFFAISTQVEAQCHGRLNYSLQHLVGPFYW